MSQQGPGPYGGGGPPGQPPPGGGYPPQGGYPPGGHPPPGAPPPPGYAPPPGYGVAPTVPEGTPPKKKNSNAGLLIALGCFGVLLLVGTASAIGVYFFYKRTAETVEAAASAFAPLVPLPVPLPMPVDPGAIPATSTESGAQTATGVAAAPGAKAPVTAPATATATATGTASAIPSAEPGTVVTCVKAAACCKAMFARTPGGAGLSASCDKLRAPNEQVCEQLLASQRSAASALGVTCE